MNMTSIDKGVRNIVCVFLGVVISLLGFYSILAYQSLKWSPMFYLKNFNSERSRIVVNTDDYDFTTVNQSVKRGQSLFLRSGCSICHGLEGKGSVANPNYINETTPKLNTLAEKLFLYDTEDVRTVLKVFESGKTLNKAEDLEVGRANAVIAQYMSVVSLIENGNASGKKDPAGYTPFDMPSFKSVLSHRNIDDIIAYLLSIYRGEEK